MIFSAPCPTCLNYRKAKGLPWNAKHIYRQRRLHDGKWRHKTRFGRAFHKMAVDYFDEAAP